jgi:hypothetical protein
MKIRILQIVLCAFLAGLTACSTMSAEPKIDVAIENKSSKDVDNTRARFGQYECSWGFLSVDAKAINGQYPHPITAETELHWDMAGQQKEQKFDLSKVYPKGKSGRLTFTVFDDRAEVAFREEK